MANKIVWDARPTAATLIGTTGALKNLANDGNAISDEYANGTNLNTFADFMLYVHDFAAAPTAGGYFACHIVYEMDTVFGDGEDGDGLNRMLDDVVGNHHFDFHLRQEINHILGAAIDLGVTLLTAKAFDIGHGQATDTDIGKSLADLVELEGFDDCGDQFHGGAPRFAWCEISSFP